LRLGERGVEVLAIALVLIVGLQSLASGNAFTALITSSSRGCWNTTE
jgi:hypothetical protein